MVVIEILRKKLYDDILKASLKNFRAVAILTYFTGVIDLMWLKNILSEM